MNKPNADELQLLYAGQLATMRALLLALIETHPQPAQVMGVFEQKIEGMRLFIDDACSQLNLEPPKHPQALQSELTQDIGRWLERIRRIVERCARQTDKPA